MTFNPGLSIGQILKNRDIVDKFQCGNMGGMRRSHATNTLVIVSDYTKGLYHDKWIDGVLLTLAWVSRVTRIFIGPRMPH